MRGKGKNSLNKFVREGITPAYAGKSAHRVRRSDSMRDHPRVCGEKHTTFFVRPRKWGSPPRMRGKVTGSARAPLNARITPAYAGKSLTIQKMTTRSRDHPRVCGEKSKVSCLKPLIRGSPPRMRGKAITLVRIFNCYRITPAYAGKSGGKSTAQR